MIKVIADQVVETDGTIDSTRAIVATDALMDILGWELKDEGLCRDELCVPADRSTLEADGGLDLVAVAGALGRPSIVDPETNAVAIGAAAADRSAALKDRVAPNFSLTDIDGESRSLADYAGKKRLLVAFSSW
jgi:hypothetical protein